MARTGREILITILIKIPLWSLISSDQINGAFDLLCKEEILRPIPQPDGNYIYRIVDNDSYFLLFFLEDLFIESVMPVIRNIWKYIRNPTFEERKWLTVLEGEIRASKIISEEYDHRRKMEDEIRRTVGGIVTVTRKISQNKKIEKAMEIERRVRSLQDELNNYKKTYEFITKKYKSLQHIFEIMFPEFLQHLELR